MVLDTSVCVDLLREAGRGAQGPATEAVGELGNTPVHLSVFSVCELETGVRLAVRPSQEQARLKHLLRRLTVLYPAPGFSALYAEAAAVLIAAGTPIPVMDLLIGVTAKAHSMPVLTRDPDHFSRVPGLVVESY
jgi:predicted nucleic acid-binding protein